MAGNAFVERHSERLGVAVTPNLLLTSQAWVRGRLGVRTTPNLTLTCQSEALGEESVRCLLGVGEESIVLLTVCIPFVQRRFRQFG